MGVKMTTAQYKVKLKAVNLQLGRKISLIGEYSTQLIKALHKCQVCKHTWMVRPANLTNCKQYCPKCNRGKNRRIPVEKLKLKLPNVHPYEDIERLSNGNLYVTVKCTENHVWHPGYHNYIRGATGCKYCLGTNKKTTKSFSKELHNKFKHLTVIGEYIGAHVPIKVECRHHGEFTQKPYVILDSINGCPKCALINIASKNTLTTKDFIEKANNVHKGIYSYRNAQYTKAHEQITVTCKTHGDWSTLARNHIHCASGCPVCADNSISSKIEKQVGNWLKKYTQIKRNDRKRLKGKEIDILCKNNLGVEINGTYWHSSLHKNKLYHYDKALLAKRNGIKLLQFWDIELIDPRTKPICMSILRNHLGQCDRWYARQLTIKQLDNQKQWFDNVHLQGGCGATIAYGLFNGDICLCAMSFGKPRFNRTCEWEIVRFANALNITVVGGASRLWSHFIKTHKPKSVISYADLRISQGDLYKQLGFKLSHVSKPNYVWTKGTYVLTRYQTQKHRLPTFLKNFNSKLSEKENMRNNQWVQLYDAGNLTYVYKKTEIDNHAAA